MGTVLLSHPMSDVMGTFVTELRSAYLKAQLLDKNLVSWAFFSEVSDCPL